MGETLVLKNAPAVSAFASVVGQKEADGPLGRRFDAVEPDARAGQDSWEKAESAMLRRAIDMAAERAGGAPGCVLAGDLLNQCAGSAYAVRGLAAPFFGLYGACSTMAEGLGLAALLVDGGYFESAAAATGSHFCSAERQFRYPLEYGGVRTPTAQWTVTGAGCVVLSREGAGPYVTRFTPGRIVDAGIKDMANMGAAMAPAAYDTLKRHFEQTGRAPGYYDVVLTGDLGRLGQEILRDLFAADGVDLGPNYMDCGVLIYDIERQDTHCGGSGCGCSASVLTGHFLRGMRDGLWRRVLFAATGALMSPTTAQQGESIPAICHAVAIESGRC
ncbi:MAG TPA: stage V sporulation protein AD [Candidatus Scatomorpha stercorigallinarum]|nr:stage V sporulation protein AD [Candidatus Scatomorpha stercorigallinarum]